MCTHVHVHAHMTGFLPQVIRGEMRKVISSLTPAHSSPDRALVSLEMYSQSQTGVRTAGGQIDFLRSR